MTEADSPKPKSAADGRSGVTRFARRATIGILERIGRAMLAGPLAEQRREIARLRREMRKEFAGLSQRTVRVERLQQQARTVRKVGFEKLNTLLRQDCLANLSSDDFPYWLTSRRFGLYSQNGEDGMIVALLGRCGVANRTFVEIGSGAGGGNSGLLAAEFGWRGLMVELDPVRQKRCARQFADEGRVACVCSRASPENINQLIADHGLSGEVDMFSLDIDSYDYWVFEAMTACQPRLMVLEYNARFGPSSEVTVPLGAPLDKGPKGYYGASLGCPHTRRRGQGLSPGGLRPVGHECLLSAQ